MHDSYDLEHAKFKKIHDRTKKKRIKKKMLQKLFKLAYDSIEV